MQKVIILSAAIIALTGAVQLQNVNHFEVGDGENAFHCPQNQAHRKYDYDRIEDRDEVCLCNKIQLSGPKVILVNLDDHCKLEEFEQDGIFIESGDLIFVTGREIAAAGQEWEEFGSSLDQSIALIITDTDLPVPGFNGTNQELVILAGVNSGQTTYQIQLTWGGKVIRRVELEIFVNQAPGICTTSRRKCDCFYNEPLVNGDQE